MIGKNSLQHVGSTDSSKPLQFKALDAHTFICIAAMLHSLLCFKSLPTHITRVWSDLRLGWWHDFMNPYQMTLQLSFLVKCFWADITTMRLNSWVSLLVTFKPFLGYPFVTDSTPNTSKTRPIFSQFLLLLLSSTLRIIIFTITRIAPLLHNNGSYIILTTTKFAIQNGINQPCSTNVFLFMDDFENKFGKMVIYFNH